jgi:hypothetical protein
MYHCILKLDSFFMALRSVLSILACRQVSLLPCMRIFLFIIYAIWIYIILQQVIVNK